MSSAASTATSHEKESANPQSDPLWQAWDEFFASVRRARGRAARQHGHELTISQWHLLSALAENPDARIAQLAESAGIAPPTATKTLDSLERAGIVERAPSVSDRRCVTVSMTRKGKRLLAEKRKLIEENRRRVFETLSSAERRQAAQLLARLSDAVDEL